MRWLSVLVSSAISFATQAGELAFVTNQNSSDVSIVDLENREEIKRVAVPGKAAGIAAARSRFYTISPDDAVLREFSHDGTLCREVKLEGGPIAVAADESRGRIFVTDWYNAQIFVVDRQSFTLAQTLPTASAPSGVAISYDKAFLATADRDSDSVSIFDAQSLEKLGAVKVGERPFGLTFSEDNLIYVTNVGSNSVSVVDPVAMKVIAEIPTGERPYGVAFAKGKGFVTDQYSDTISVFDASDHGALKRTESGEYPEGIDRNGAQSEIYVANWFSNTLGVIDVSSLEMVDEILVGDGPRAFGLFVAEQSMESCDAPL